MRVHEGVVWVVMVVLREVGKRHLAYVLACVCVAVLGRATARRARRPKFVLAIEACDEEPELVGVHLTGWGPVKGATTKSSKTSRGISSSTVEEMPPRPQLKPQPPKILVASNLRR